MNLPVKRSLVDVAFKSRSMFTHGTARDGSPLLIFRGCVIAADISEMCLYDMCVVLFCAVRW